MGGFTLLLLLMLIVLYGYLLLVRKELVFISQNRRSLLIAIPFLAAGALLLTFHEAQTMEEHLRGIIAACFILSFLLDGRGLATDKIVTNAMDLKGIAYQDVSRVVLLYTEGKTKMNFFRLGMRGPLLIFDAPVSEVAIFLAENLKKGTPIEILVDDNEGKNEKRP